MSVPARSTDLRLVNPRNSARSESVTADFSNSTATILPFGAVTQAPPQRSTSAAIFRSRSLTASSSRKWGIPIRRIAPIATRAAIHKPGRKIAVRRRRSPGLVSACVVGMSSVYGGGAGLLNPSQQGNPWTFAEGSMGPPIFGSIWVDSARDRLRSASQSTQFAAQSWVAPFAVLSVRGPTEPACFRLSDMPNGLARRP